MIDLRSRIGDRRSRRRQNFTAVDQCGHVYVYDSHPCERVCEHRGHQILIVDEGLPETGSNIATSKVEIGLETQFADVEITSFWEWGFYFAYITCGSGESDATEQNFEEELGVELAVILSDMISRKSWYSQ